MTVAEKLADVSLRYLQKAFEEAQDYPSIKEGNLVQFKHTHEDGTVTRWDTVSISELKREIDRRRCLGVSWEFIPSELAGLYSELYVNSGAVIPGQTDIPYVHTDRKELEEPNARIRRVVFEVLNEVAAEQAARTQTPRAVKELREPDGIIVPPMSNQ
jgi:hypothetical protein